MGLQPKYRCPWCEDLHDDEWDARHCCPPDIQEVFVCPVCGDEYGYDETSATQCCGMDEPPHVTAVEL